MKDLHQDISEILVTREELDATVQRLGDLLTQRYQGEEVLVVGILRGAAVFMSDIIRAMNLPVEIDFMDVTSYGDGTESSGEIRIIKDLETNVKGRHVLIVEDIIDTGRTLRHVVDLLNHRQAESVTIVALLDKPERRAVKDISADYVGLEVPNEFVVGYGLDYAQKYRNLPYIGVLKPEIYS